MNEKKNFSSSLGSNLFVHPGLKDLLQMLTSMDGYARERAVRRLGMLGDPSSIPYLIVRANDWVPEVRAAAYDALIKLLKAGSGEAFVTSLPDILHLQTCRRGDHSGLLQAVQDFLLREDNRHALVAGLQSPDARIARLVIRLLVDRRLMSPSELVTRGLSHKDVHVRSIAVDLLRDLGSDDFTAAVSRALRDPYMAVRREAFQQLLRRDPDWGMRAARDFLFDASASIREIAVRRLLSAGEPVEEIYARTLAEGQSRVAIIRSVLWGWGLLNSQSRIGLVRQLLDAPFPTVRRVALQSIARLLRDDAKPHLVAALGDPSPAVCKEAARLMTKFRVAPSVETLIAIATMGGASHVAYACCRVIRSGSKWDWLKFILSVYGSPDATVPRETFSSEINAWEWHFNGSSAQPSKRTLDEIVSLLPSCEAKLSTSQAGLLKFTLRSYGVTL